MVRRTTEEAKLLALRAEHSNLETEQTAYTSTGNATKESELYGEYQELLGKTEEKAAEIAQQEKLIESIQTTIDDLFQQKEDIVAACKFDQFFTAEEALLLDKYIRTSDFNEPSFVYREYTTYDTDDISESANQLIVTVSRASITQIPSDSGKELYRITAGGSDTSDTPARLNAIVYKGNSTSDIKGDIVNCIIEKKADSSVILTAELADGTYNNTPFVSACLSILADNFSIYDSDIALDEDVNAQYQTGTRLLVHTDAATVYFTQGVTEYSKRSVEWELYEFAAAELEKAAWPKYQFTVDSANFLSAKEFEVFRKQFKLGTRIYLDLDGGLTPIAIGAEIDLDDPTSLSLTFGDEYSALDSAFQLVDILDQSVSMGKTYSANKGAYGNFISSGSKDALYNFINAPLDVAKNSIISSSNQAMQFDSAGLRLRRYADASMTTYDPEQIWMCHNSIVFTRDNWTTAEMAIGKFEDPYLGEQYGICAPAIMGTIIAGNKLWIRSSTEHGGVAEFQVDGAGARLYNAKFDLCNEDGLGNTGYISLNPELGIVGGIDKTGAPLFGASDDGSVYGVLTTSGKVMTSLEDLDKNDLPRANFWVDMNGDVYFNGNGVFSGTVYASDGKFTGKWMENDPVLLNGEIAIATVPASTGAVKQEPAILMKVGNGTDKFSALPFTSAKAADVAAWALADTKPTYEADEIVGLTDYINGEIQDSNTTYNLVQDTTDAHILILQKQEIGETSWTEVTRITTVDSKYDTQIAENAAAISALSGLVGTTAVADQIGAAIDALKLSETYDAKGAAASAETAAKAYADGLAVNYDSKGSAAAAEAAAKAYADGLADNYDAKGSAAEAEAAAKAYADGLAGNYDAKGAAEAVKSELQGSINTLGGQVSANSDAIEVLNGTGEGSVDAKIDAAFNEFSTRVTFN